MDKLVVHREDDPDIGVVYEEVPEGDLLRPAGFHGECTECGRIFFFWRRGRAVRGATSHLARHTAQAVKGSQ